MQALFWWSNRWQKTEYDSVGFCLRYLCQTDLLLFLAQFLHLVAVSLAVMSMAVHGANLDEGTSMAALDLKTGRPQLCGSTKNLELF